MAIVLILFLVTIYKFDQEKTKAEYKFYVNSGYAVDTSEGLSFDQLINIIPFFDFKKNIANLKNLVPQANPIRLDHIFFELFMKNLLDLNSNSEFLKKEKINFYKSDNKIIL